MLQALSEGVTVSQKPVRVLVAKAGLDGHDRGAKVVARALRDAGMEVVYTGLHRTPEQIVSAAVQEDVDVVGVSILSGAHMTLMPRIVALLEAQGASDIRVVVGGVIRTRTSSRCAPRRRGGLRADTPPDDIVNRVRDLAKARPAQ
jgi:methylmalonyl-CoA mutase C-terminal domain/subunit